jgi:hypothetical protein
VLEKGEINKQKNRANKTVERGNFHQNFSRSKDISSRYRAGNTYCNLRLFFLKENLLYGRAATAANTSEPV